MLPDGRLCVVGGGCYSSSACAAYGFCFVALFALCWVRESRATLWSFASCKLSFQATSWPTPSLPWWRYCGTSHMCTFSTLPPSNGHIRSRQARQDSKLCCYMLLLQWQAVSQQGIDPISSRCTAASCSCLCVSAHAAGHSLGFLVRRLLLPGRLRSVVCSMSNL